MLADRVAEGWGGVGVGLVVKRLCIKEMGRGVGKKEREGHRYREIGRMSNEDEKPEGGLKRRRQEEKTEVRQKRGRRQAGRNVFTLENAWE